MPSILIVLSGADRWSQLDGRQRPTGVWAEEFVVPHRALRDAGVAVTVATPEGRRPTIDAESLAPQTPGNNEQLVAELQAYLSRPEIVAELANPVRLTDIEPDDFDGVLLPGGHGPMQDLVTDPNLARILAAMLPNENRLVAGLCHGPAGFLAAGDDDQWLFSGRRLTAFSDVEETQTGRAANAPWLLESRLRAAGAEFEAGDPWGSFVVVDGNLITGQNPASAEAVTESILQRLALGRV
jgi:putative intracellular protease/amidase